MVHRSATTKEQVVESSIQDITDTMYDKYHKKIGYRLNKTFWESQDLPLMVAKKGQKIGVLLKAFSKKWNASHKDFRIDFILHPKNNTSIVVLQSADKKNRRDISYKGECGSGYIQFAVDSARIINVPKVHEKNMKYLINVLCVIKVTFDPDKNFKRPPPKPTFMGKVANLFK